MDNDKHINDKMPRHKMEPRKSQVWILNVLYLCLQGQYTSEAHGQNSVINMSLKNL